MDGDPGFALFSSARKRARRSAPAAAPPTAQQPATGVATGTAGAGTSQQRATDTQAGAPAADRQVSERRASHAAAGPRPAALAPGQGQAAGRLHAGDVAAGSAGRQLSDKAARKAARAAAGAQADQELAQAGCADSDSGAGAAGGAAAGGQPGLPALVSGGGGGGATAATATQATEAEAAGAAAPAVHGKDDDGVLVTFRELGVSEWLERVCASLGIVKPTPVQRGCIPHILKGRDVIGTAHTGSGKTAAFALPILQHLARERFGVFALVLTPTRELAMQLAEQFRALGSGMELKAEVVIGGLDMKAQARALARRPHVVIATPGRLRDLLEHTQELAPGFARARYLVLDEADRLLEPSFESELRAIAGALPPERQTLLFSATMTRSLVALQSAALRDAYHFQAYEGLETAAKLREEYLFIPAKVKEVYLAWLLEHLADSKVRSAMIFTSTCKGCHLLAAVLAELDIACAALHSGQPQTKRLAALDRFKGGRVAILLATDVASRGLDIPTVDLVVNYDLPLAARDYVHRVGRTARAGRGGWALSLVTQDDVELVHGIEELVGHQLAEYSPDEKDVLKGITKVYKAKRAAAMRVAEENGFGVRGEPKSGGNKRQRQQQPV